MITDLSIIKYPNVENDDKIYPKLGRSGAKGGRFKLSYIRPFLQEKAPLNHPKGYCS